MILPHIIWLIDPLREINSYNHGLAIQDGQDNIGNTNSYHFRSSYEYEPRKHDSGVDEYKGKIKTEKKLVLTQNL